LTDPRIKKSEDSIILCDESLLAHVSAVWFEESYWRNADGVIGTARGRGAALFVRHGEEVWVLRHYHRGGLMTNLTDDLYIWTGLERTRAFLEWHLLLELRARGLPVPQPIAARIQRRGVGYRADIITDYIEDTQSLATRVTQGSLSADEWNSIGRMLQRFHQYGVYHSDLTAHNILIDTDGRVFLLDFDKGALKTPGPWQQANLRRLQRSLRKVALEAGTAFDNVGWDLLARAYQARA